ncbi:MAG: transposase, partial [Erysipelotrichaceae bacterium]|nr:transposase [Erysipelotrichaceae bacterium]
KATENEHFLWFARLLESHFEGIVNHAKYHISTGKLEGINCMIKTERRKGYGYPDDEYFFLRLMDASRRKQIY